MIDTSEREEVPNDMSVTSLRMILCLNTTPTTTKKHGCECVWQISALFDYLHGAPDICLRYGDCHVTGWDASRDGTL